LRTIAKNIESLRLATLEVRLDNGQVFYETPKSYEIWREKPLQRVKRFDKKRVFWVNEKK
jgi:hypothetical protein